MRSTIWMRLGLLAAGALLLAACGGDDSGPGGGTGSANNAPVINTLRATSDTFVADNTDTIIIEASDPDGDGLTYQWEAHGSSFMVLGGGASIQVTNCCPITTPATTFVVATVSDGRGGQATDSVEVCVIPSGG